MFLVNYNNEKKCKTVGFCIFLTAMVAIVFAIDTKRKKPLQTLRILLCLLQLNFQEKLNFLKRPTLQKQSSSLYLKGFEKTIFKTPNQKNIIMKIHRFYAVAAIGLLSFASAFAQDSTKTNYLFSGKMGKINHLGVYIAPEIQYNSLAGGFTPMGGMSAMLLINRKFGVGITGYSTFGNYTPTILSSSKSLNLDAEFGGVKIEYTPNPFAAVHLTFSLMGGVGFVNIDSAKNNLYERNNGKNRNDNYFGKENGSQNGFAVIQPGVALEANLFRFAKLFAGVSYRITSGGSASYTPTGSTKVAASLANSDLAGLNLSAGIKIGIFDYALHGRKRNHEKHKKHG